MVGFHLRKATLATKGSMDWEERLMGAMSGCAGWALHNSTGATVPSMVAVAVEKG